MNLKLNYSLKDYNSFGLDNTAEKFVEFVTEEELKSYLASNSIDIRNLLILGGGSNILLSDDFHGTVIKVSFTEIQIVKETESNVLIKSGAGVVWDNLVEFTVTHNYSGIENLSLIPGNSGAAPIQNIGAYGQELSNVFYSLEGYSIPEGDKKVFNKEQCGFGYRDSIFKKEYKNKFIITAVTLSLNKKFHPNLIYAPVREELNKSGITNPLIQDIRDIIITIRRRKLPDPKILGNAGSFFKNPEIKPEQFEEIVKTFPDIKGFPAGEKIKLYAGQLIEKCGWKGIREGNVGSHSEQSLVIVNYGEATGKEIIRFSKKIKESVFNTFGIMLQEEVNII